MRRLSKNEAKLSLAGTEGNREKKFEFAGSPKFIGEGESVAGCDISVKDLCGQIITSELSKRSESSAGSYLVALGLWGPYIHHIRMLSL